MRVTCSSCSANYTIADDKVRNKRVKLRCKKCGKTIVVDGENLSGAPAASVGEDDGGGQESAISLQPIPSSLAGEPWMVNLSDEDEREMTLEQIVAGFRDGTVTDDAFAWKEGMADWVPVLQVPEIKAAIDAGSGSGAEAAVNRAPTAAAKEVKSSPVATKLTAPRASFQSKSAEPTAKKASVSFGAKAATSAKVAGVPRAATAKSSAVADLFGAAAKAGSEEDIVVGPSVDPAPKPRVGVAHNESSVMFSLDALKAGFSGGGAVPKPSTTQPKSASIEDIMGLPAASASMGLLDMGAPDLLTAPAPKPKPKPKPVEPPKEVPVSVIEVPVALPPPSNKRWIMVAAVVLIGLLGIGGLVTAMMGPSEEEQQRVAALEEKLKKAQELAKQQEKERKEAEALAAEKAKEAERLAAEEAKKTEKAETKKGSPSTTDSQPTKVASTRTVTGSSPSSTDKQPKKEEPKKDEKKPVKVTVSDNPSSGVSTFNTGAARSALSVAASGAAGCKKADGPTGSGRVMVTFAPSGRVTSANVVGAPFAGTSVGGCVATIFRRATVPAFSGAPVTVSKSFRIN